jgi:hypothetical protein
MLAKTPELLTELLRQQVKEQGILDISQLLSEHSPPSWLKRSEA